MSENKHKKAQEEKHSNVKYAVVGVLSVVLVAFLLVWNTGIITPPPTYSITCAA